MYFLVAPYFAGRTGNYSFDVEIERTLISNVSESVHNEPTISIDTKSDQLHVSNQDNQIKIVKLVNLQGQIISSIEVENGDNDISIDLKNLTQGVFLIQIYTSNGVFIQKYNRIL